MVMKPSPSSTGVAYLSLIISLSVLLFVYRSEMRATMDTVVSANLARTQKSDEKPEVKQASVVIPTMASQFKENERLSVSFLQNYYTKYAAERHSQLRTVNLASNYATLYNVLVPEAYCPNLVRVGNVNDGGKWVCNPGQMPKQNCSIYSLGLRNDITFDHDIQEFNGNHCNIYGYDMTDQSPSTKAAYAQINGKTKALKITEYTTKALNQYNLGDLLRENNDTQTEILKMDIEGSEYTTLVPFLKEFKACQIFLEMHGKSHKMLELLDQVTSLDYWLFFYEINGFDITACEYSFIHSSCMDRYGLFKLGRYLPGSYGVVPG